MDYSAIVLCAGSGKRTELGYNKMFFKKNHWTVYEKTMQVFLRDPQCRQVVVVCKKEEQRAFEALVSDHRITYVQGGEERQDSVFAGLKAVSEEYVLIHDGARPYLKQEAIDRLLACLEVHDACLLMVPAKDTIKRVINGQVIETLKREELMQAQTPQAFKTALILQAYQKALDAHLLATDDASMAELQGIDVYVVEGDYDNIKITTREDLNG